MFFSTTANAQIPSQIEDKNKLQEIILINALKQKTIEKYEEGASLGHDNARYARKYCKNDVRRIDGDRKYDIGEDLYCTATQHEIQGYMYREKAIDFLKEGDVFWNQKSFLDSTAKYYLATFYMKLSNSSLEESKKAYDDSMKYYGQAWDYYTKKD